MLTYELSYSQSWFIYLSLLTVAFVSPLLIPYFRGMLIIPETVSAITIRTKGSLVGAAYLFAGGLAVLTSLELAIGLLTLLIAFYRLTDNSYDSNFSPERILIRLLSNVNRNPLGFAILFSLTTELYLVTEFYLRATPADIVMLAWAKSWELYPVTNLVILSISVAGGGVATAIAVIYFRAPKVSTSPSNTHDALGSQHLVDAWDDLCVGVGLR